MRQGKEKKKNGGKTRNQVEKKEGMVGGRGWRETERENVGDEEGKSTIIKIMEYLRSGPRWSSRYTKYDSDIPVPWVSPVSQDPLCIQPGLIQRKKDHRWLSVFPSTPLSPAAKPLYSFALCRCSSLTLCPNNVPADEIILVCLLLNPSN